MVTKSIIFVGVTASFTVFPPKKTALVLFEPPPKRFLTAVKSPKFEALLVVAIVIKSIVFITEPVSPPP